MYMRLVLLQVARGGGVCANKLLDLGVWASRNCYWQGLRLGSWNLDMFNLQAVNLCKMMPKLNLLMRLKAIS